MTVSEIYSVIWAATRSSDYKQDNMSELYDDLMIARACYNVNNDNQESEQ